jgi:hypothetical protein
MNKFLKTVVAVLFGAMVMGCEPVDKPQELPQLDVTPNNVAGSWELVSWMGEPLAEGSYVYLDLVRSGRTYTMYQNIDSHDARTITGRYYIEVDDLGKAVIRGNYDHSVGEWNNRYVITSLTAEQMIWQAEGNDADVSVYQRADIPAEIVAE